MDGKITSRRSRLGVVTVATVALSILAGLALAILRDREVEAQSIQTPPSAAAASSSGPSPKSSEALMEPSLIPAARQATTEGAVEFFGYFLDVYRYAYMAGDPSLFKSLTVAGCDFCSGVVTSIEEANVAGQTLEIGRIDVTTAVAAPGDPAKGLVVNAVVQQAPGLTRDRTGAVVSRTDGRKDLRMEARLLWTSNGWKVRAVRVLKDPQ